MTRTQFIVLVAAAFLSWQPCVAVGHPDISPEILKHPKVRQVDSNADVIKGQFIIGVKKGQMPVMAMSLEPQNPRSPSPIMGTYNAAYHVALPDASPSFMNDVLNNDAVDFVEPLQRYRMHEYSWGLDRIDQRPTDLDRRPMTRPAGTKDGEGVDVYIVDSGVEVTHQEFGGRARVGFSAFDGSDGIDRQGHGTHVAGIVGGATYGVAPKVNIIAIQVLDAQGSGTTATIIAGLTAIAAMHNTSRPGVVQMSLGGGLSRGLDAAVNDLLDIGLTIVASAGNANKDACYNAPAAHRRVLGVAASSQSDELSSYSDYGDCVYMVAPGDDIVSAGLGNKMGEVKTGTSMAAPFVSGAAALYLAANPRAMPTVVIKALFDAADVDMIEIPKEKDRTPNRLLYVGPNAFQSKDDSGSARGPDAGTTTDPPTPQPAPGPGAQGENGISNTQIPSECAAARCPAAEGKVQSDPPVSVKITVGVNQRKLVTGFLSGPPGISLVLSKATPIISHTRTRRQGAANVYPGDTEGVTMNTVGEGSVSAQHITVRYTVMNLQPSKPGNFAKLSRCLAPGTYRFSVLATDLTSIGKTFNIFVVDLDNSPPC